MIREGVMIGGVEGEEGIVGVEQQILITAHGGHTPYTYYR